MAVPIPPPDGAADFARRLGTTAFAAYVVLAFDAEQRDDGRLLVAVSARRLAARLGVGKDAAAEALRRLSAAGLLLDAPRQDERTGRFTVAVRELLSVADIGPCRHSEDTAIESTPRRRKIAVDVAQLDLFSTRAVVGDDGSFDSQVLRDSEAQVQSCRQPSLFKPPQTSHPGTKKQDPGGFTPLHQGCGEWPDDVTGRSSPVGRRPC